MVREPKIGQLVRVLSSKGDVEGVVESNFNDYDDTGPKVTVRFPPPDSEHAGIGYSVAFDFPREMVYPVTPGLSVPGYRERLRSSLERLVPGLLGAPTLESWDRRFGARVTAGSDFVIHGSSGPILVETDPGAGDGLEIAGWRTDLLVMLVANSGAPGGVFVSDNQLSSAAGNRLRAAGLRWARWRGPDDDERLAEVLQNLLEELAAAADG